MKSEANKHTEGDEQKGKIQGVLEKPDIVCVATTVKPSMRKDRTYIPCHPDHKGIKCPCDYCILPQQDCQGAVIILLHLCIT